MLLKVLLSFLFNWSSSIIVKRLFEDTFFKWEKFQAMGKGKPSIEEEAFLGILVFYEKCFKF